MAEADDTRKLETSKASLETSLQKSKALASALANSGRRLEAISQRVLPLEAAIRIAPTQKYTFLANHVDHAIGPAMAVLKVYDSIQGLENLLVSQPFSTHSTYLSLLKKLKEALKFLYANCTLAIQWLETILHFLRDNNVVVDDEYLLGVNKCLRILQRLQMTEKRACLRGGLLFAAFEKFVIEFKQLLTDSSTPVDLAFISSSVKKQDCMAPSSPIPAVVVQKLQAIVGGLSADNNRLEQCLLTCIDVRSTNAKRSLEALDLDYIETSITQSDDAEDMEGLVDQWCKHFELAVKHVFEAEYKLCNDVFGKISSDLWRVCFAKIAIQSGILTFLEFVKRFTECKNDPMKLLKLLDIFASLHNLRVDFSRLFGGEACVEVQTLTRDIIKRVVDGVCNIFWELPAQVKLQRQSCPPSDGSVPRLVSFVTDYCNQLLGDHYRPLLIQVLAIHQCWKQEKNLDGEGLLISQTHFIIKEIALNLDAWSKSHRDIALSYLFMMNNHCHFCSLKGTKIGDLMGDSWLRAHEQYKDYYMGLYLGESWGTILALIRQESQIVSSPSRKKNSWLPASDLVRKKLKRFNNEFDSTYERQSRWVVPDENLRLKMCKIVVHAFIPLYRSYLQNHGLLTAQNFSPSRYVKYSAEGLEAMLSSLFQPNLEISVSTKHLHLIRKIKAIVTDRFHSALMVV